MTSPDPTPPLARIQKIEIQGLFGLYNHTIPLNLDERVTILYGVNGVGKTTVLNIIEQVFGHPERQRSQFSPHSQDRLRLVQKIKQLHFQMIDGSKLIFNRADPSADLNFSRYQSRFPIRVATKQKNLLIPTRRLDVVERIGQGYKQKDAVVSIAEILKQDIGMATIQYGKDAQEIDQSFPLRALQAQPNKTLEDVRAIIQRYEEVQDELQRVNIFPANHTPPLPLNDTSPEKLAILYVHTEDSINKLAAFQDVAAKANALLEMVNSRLIHKTMEISREHGFQIKSHTGKVIPLNSLSSGEQHQLVILFDLIFRTQAGALVLIDEPEISMHLSWQSLFIRDLIRIAKMNAFDAIVATHSPAIIDKYWNLTVELKAEITPNADAEAAQASHA